MHTAYTNYKHNILLIQTTSKQKSAREEHFYVYL